MCNLYRLERAQEAVARLFRVRSNTNLNYASELYPGYTGLVIAGGELRAMTWGFPLSLKGKDGRQLKPKAVTNAREDKLHTAFWRDSFVNRRCLVPMTAWAEAEGPKGQMTRSWYSLPDTEAFAVGGVWCRSDEWGEVYSLVMVDGCEQMAAVHDRMPVVLREADWARWTDGEPAEAFGLCQTWSGALVVDQTQDRWAPGRA